MCTDMAILLACCLLGANDGTKSLLRKLVTNLPLQNLSKAMRDGLKSVGVCGADSLVNKDPDKLYDGLQQVFNGDVCNNNFKSATTTKNTEALEALTLTAAVAAASGIAVSANVKEGKFKEKALFKFSKDKLEEFTADFYLKHWPNLTPEEAATAADAAAAVFRDVKKLAGRLDELRIKHDNLKARKAAAEKAAAAAAAAPAAMDADSDEDEQPPPPPRTRKLPPRDPPPRDPPPRDPPPRDPPPRDLPPSPRQRPSPRGESPSPPRSVQQLKRLISGLKAAQAVPGQEPAAKTARAQELDGAEFDLAERVRKCKKYGHW